MNFLRICIVVLFLLYSGSLFADEWLKTDQPSKLQLDIPFHDCSAVNRDGLFRIFEDIVGIAEIEVVEYTHTNSDNEFRLRADLDCYFIVPFEIWVFRYDLYFIRDMESSKFGSFSGTSRQFGGFGQGKLAWVETRIRDYSRQAAEAFAKENL